MVRWQTNSARLSVGDRMKQVLYPQMNSVDRALSLVTTAQVDFFEKEIGYDRAKAVLDIGCGIGRHSLELARRGYRVTGIDLSDHALFEARQMAASENLKVNFICQDARVLNFYDQFQAALLINQAVFSVMETDEMAWLILRNIAQALRPGGLFFLTVPNAARLFANSSLAENFDLTTCRSIQNSTVNGHLVSCSQRFYTCPEIHWLLRQSGFQKIRFFAINNAGIPEFILPGMDQNEFGVIAEK